MTASMPFSGGRWELHAAARTDTGRVRTENQDAHGLFPSLGLFVVADGLGGHQGGRFASRMAVAVLRDELAMPSDDDLTPVSDTRGLVSLGARRLTHALQQANARVWDAARDASRQGMGTTVAALLFDSRYDVVAICHVGDSRIFRVRGREVTLLTEDHTVVQQWVREGRIPAADAATSPHRHMITQAVGTQETLAPAMRLERPEIGDVFLVTSDGVHDRVQPDEMATVVREANADAEIACFRLVELANERGGRDNATALMVCVTPVAVAAADDDDDPTLAT
jgi:protein phosphatase